MDAGTAMTAKNVWSRPQDTYKPDLTDVTPQREHAHSTPRRVYLAVHEGPPGEGRHDRGRRALTAWAFVSHAKVAQPNGGRLIQVVRFAGGNHFVGAIVSGALKSTLINARYATDQPHVNLPEETMRILANNN